MQRTLVQWLGVATGQERRRRQLIQATIASHGHGPVTDLAHGFLLGVAHGSEELTDMTEHLIARQNLLVKLQEQIDLATPELRVLKRLVRNLKGSIT